MLVVMRCGATDRQIQGVVQAITELGCKARQLHGAQRTTVNVVGNDERIDSARLASLDGVQDSARQVASAVGRRIASPAPAKLGS